jgi:hypothetical protein
MFEILPVPLETTGKNDLKNTEWIAEMAYLPNDIMVKPVL